MFLRGMDFCRLEIYRCCTCDENFWTLDELFATWFELLEVLHPGAPQFIYFLHEAARKALVEVA